jgi:hypothetical protein
VRAKSAGWRAKFKAKCGLKFLAFIIYYLHSFLTVTFGFFTQTKTTNTFYYF